MSHPCPTIAFKTFGCRLNRAETAQFEADFAAAGFALVPFGQAADLVVVHTCTVTQNAENECLKFLRRLRKNFPVTQVIVAGCAVETAAHAQMLAMGVALIVTREQRDNLAAYVIHKLGLSKAPLPQPYQPRNHRATLKVQDGCDFNCTYCIIPHTRGAPQSRPFSECLTDAQVLIDKGFRELVVTGCNIACYADKGRTLVDLLTAIAALPGLGRLRLGSLEPGTVERDVMACMAQTPSICRFLHLPIQSGTDEILAGMGRRYNMEELRKTLTMAFQQIPDLGLGADIITGFPGETPELFEKTRAFLEEWPFSNLHVFPYSERPGTLAATFEGCVPIRERKRRVSILNALKNRARTVFAQQLIGHQVQILVEKIDDSGSAVGWTSEYISCRIISPPPASIRQLVACVPYAAAGTTLIAKNGVITA